MPPYGALTSSLKRPIHMGVCALLTCTEKTDCRKASGTLARSMLLLIHCSKASSQVRFLASSRMVRLLTSKGSVGTWATSSLSEKSEHDVSRWCQRSSISPRRSWTRKSECPMSAFAIVESYWARLTWMANKLALFSPSYATLSLF